MDVKFSLALPREALSIPVMRRVLGDALRALGVTEECVCDILVAVSEACTNVVRHAGPAKRYEVVACVDGGWCVLKVLDRGRGFDPRRARARHLAGGEGAGEPAELAESGRGMQIMRALVDDVTFGTRKERGTVVYLQKRLTWRGGAMMAGEPGTPPLRHAG